MAITVGNAPHMNAFFRRDNHRTFAGGFEPANHGADYQRVFRIFWEYSGMTIWYVYHRDLNQ